MLAQYLQSAKFDASPWLIAGVVAFILFVRYLIFAGGALWLVLANRNALADRRIQPTPFTAAQLRREAAWSGVSALVFGLVAFLAQLANHEFGFMAIYEDIDAYGWAWFWLSIPAAILVHDFYFYWAHRLMHAPGIFEKVHKVHHLSTNPSPLSAFAFHPYEAAIEALGLVVVLSIVPLHPLAFLAFSTFLIGFNVLGHLGYELFPRFSAHTPVLRLLNTATSHNQHHRTFQYNFGLYTLIWDRLFGTLHPRYEAAFYKAAGKQTSPPLAITHEKEQSQ